MDWVYKHFRFVFIIVLILLLKFRRIKISIGRKEGFKVFWFWGIGLMEEKVFIKIRIHNCTYFVAQVQEEQDFNRKEGFKIFGFGE